MPGRDPELLRKLREKRKQARGGGGTSRGVDPRAAMEKQVMDLAGDDPDLLGIVNDALRDPHGFVRTLGSQPKLPKPVEGAEDEEDDDEGLPPSEYVGDGK